MIDFIERTPIILRWIMVPFVFVILSFLIKGSIFIISFIFSLIWIHDAPFNFWLYDFIISEVLLSLCATYYSGVVAPKYKLITTSFFISIFVFINLIIIYYAFTIDGLYTSDDFIAVISNFVGCGLSFYWAKQNFYL